MVDPEKLRALASMHTPVDEATWARCLADCPELGNITPNAVYTNLRALAELLAREPEQLRALIVKAPNLVLVDPGKVQEEVRGRR